jgi:hypothetical protein
VETLRRALLKGPVWSRKIFQRCDVNLAPVADNTSDAETFRGEAPNFEFGDGAQNRIAPVTAHSFRFRPGRGDDRRNGRR